MEDIHIQNQPNLDEGALKSPADHVYLGMMPATQMALNALESSLNVTLLDASHTVSPIVLNEVHNRINDEFSNEYAFHFNLDGISSISELINGLVNQILFYNSEDDAELVALAREYLSNYEYDIHSRYNPFGRLYIEIEVFLGKDPLSAAKDLLHTMDVICSHKSRRLDLCLDNVDAIENLKERDQIVSLLQMYLFHLKNISVLATFRSKTLHDDVTFRLRPNQFVCIELTPQGYLTFDEVATEKVERKRGRKPGTKNKKTSEKVNGSKSSDKPSEIQSDKSSEKNPKDGSSRKRKYEVLKEPKTVEGPDGTIIEERGLIKVTEYAATEDKSETQVH